MRLPQLEREHPSCDGGTQRLYRFANGYGASVVQFLHSYGGIEGLWELAVVEFSGEAITRFRLTYDTPITDDVLGRLTDDDVDRLLGEIEALPQRVEKRRK